MPATPQRDKTLSVISGEVFMTPEHGAGEACSWQRGHDAALEGWNPNEGQKAVIDSFFLRYLVLSGATAS